MKYKWTFEVCPVAASRPRIGKHGAYYTGSYKEFRKLAVSEVWRQIGEDFIPLEGPLNVSIQCCVTRPKNTKLQYPRGDVDNFIKSCLDAGNGRIWLDDTQVVRIQATKEWTSSNDVKGYFTVDVENAEAPA
jgi:Holliday junction resolvase RusA-like endonuclease